MKKLGLSDLLRWAFVSVNKILSSQSFPQNLRALRMVVEKLLRGSINDMIRFDDLPAFLQTLREQSPKSKLWVDNLTRPVFYMMFFVRGEREGDWPLHLYLISKMILYLYAAGHQNYAHYGMYYLHDMKKLPDCYKAL